MHITDATINAKNVPANSTHWVCLRIWLLQVPAHLLDTVDELQVQLFSTYVGVMLPVQRDSTPEWQPASLIIITPVNVLSCIGEVRAMAVFAFQERFALSRMVGTANVHTLGVRKQNSCMPCDDMVVAAVHAPNMGVIYGLTISQATFDT